MSITARAARRRFDPHGRVLTWRDRVLICRLEGVGVDNGGDARHLCDLTPPGGKIHQDAVLAQLTAGAAQQPAASRTLVPARPATNRRRSATLLAAVDQLP